MDKASNQEALLRLAPILKDALRVQESILDALLKLKDKRITLEEKMITRYLHYWSASLLKLLAVVHEDLAVGKGSLNKEEATSFISLNQSMLEALFELHKAIDYDLNYLEQYFEHGFFLRLEQELRFPERLTELAFKLAES